MMNSSRQDLSRELRYFDIKDRMMFTLNRILDILNIESVSEEEAVESWYYSQSGSPDIIFDAMYMALQYETHLINTTPARELPLLIGRLVFRDDLLTKRMKEETCPSSTTTPTDQP